MDELQLFNYQGRQVRTVQINDEPWFVAKDVCDVLEIENPTQAVGRLDEDERAMFNIGRQGDTNIISESGLYALVLGSRKPEAKAFKRWVTHEVIPSIRKHGAYMTPETIEKTLTDPDFIIGLATRLKEANAKIEQDKPKVAFAEAVESSKDSILIGAFAKMLKQNGLDIGQNRLFKWMRDNGYLCSGEGQYNVPTQSAMNNGLFEIKERTVEYNGSPHIVTTTVLTGRGQIYFANKLKEA